MKRTLLIPAILIVVLSSVSAAVRADEGDCASFSTDYCFNVTSGDYDVGSNWVFSGGGNGVPTASHTITIPAGRTCNIDTTEAAKTVKVQVDGGDRGSIVIKKAGTFKLGPALTVSTLEGDIAFSSAGSGNDPVLKLGANHYINGSSGATISASGVTATITSDHATQSQYRLTLNSVTLSGRFTITCQLTNNGIVDASASSGVIELGTASAPTGSGEWKVTGAAARLQFRDDAVSLTGRFEVTQGILDIDENVTTSGRFYIANGGTVQVAAGRLFKAGQ